MKCVNCNSEIMDNTVVCPYCGAVNSNDYSIAGQVSYDIARKKQQSKIAKKIIITIVAIILTVAVALTVMINVVLPAIQLSRASSMIDDGRFVPAITLLDKYARSKDDIDILNSAINSEVERYIDNGDYVGAQDFLDSLNLQNVTTVVTISKETKRLAYESMALYCGEKAYSSSSYYDSCNIDKIEFYQPGVSDSNYPVIVVYKTNKSGIVSKKYISAYSVTDMSVVGTISEDNYLNRNSEKNLDNAFAIVLDVILENDVNLNIAVDYDRINKLLASDIEINIDPSRYAGKWQ